MDADKSGFVDFNEILDILMSDVNDSRLEAIKNAWKEIGAETVSLDDLCAR